MRNEITYASMPELSVSVLPETTTPGMMCQLCHVNAASYSLTTFPAVLFIVFALFATLISFTNQKKCVISP